MKTLKRIMGSCLLCGLVILGLLWPTLTRSPLNRVEATTVSIEPYLYSAQFTQGQAALQAQLQQNPQDEQARFGLGVIQLMAGVERLTQSLYRYGLQDSGLTSSLPILRLPIPKNPQPDPLAYADTRQVLQTWLTDLTTVQATLEPIATPTVNLSLRLAAMRLDINNDGRATEDESFRRLFEVMTMTRISEVEARAFQIDFDYGDVLWLRGYCHLLSAMTQLLLTHDAEALFNATAHLLFAQPVTPYGFLQGDRRPFAIGSGFDLSDVIAFIHLLRFPVVSPNRMTKALEHFQATLALSRQSWQAIAAETDNQLEWLPNPNQQGVIPGMPVTQDMIDAWLAFTVEADQLLAGKVLAPFWRGDDSNTDLGVNVNKLFTEPRILDAVLWIQGSAAAPYLESGSLTDASVWQQLMQVFGGQFFNFAAWFN